MTRPAKRVRWSAGESSTGTQYIGYPSGRCAYVFRTSASGTCWTARVWWDGWEVSSGWHNTATAAKRAAVAMARRLAGDGGK
jgi:hypothetical protein